MKQSERFELIDRLARELQSRFKTYELDGYLNSMGVKTPESAVGTNSKWVYAKGVLASESADTLIRIANDLDFDAGAVVAGAVLPPKCWGDAKRFRLFISHISKHKDRAMRLRDCLEPYAISAFVAHEDIEPTKPWEAEIRKALHTMDAFVSMHTPGFCVSNWTQQEIGFAVGRGKKIIAFRMGEDPTGFLSKDQALLRKGRNAEQIAEEIVALLAEDPMTSDKLAEAKKTTAPTSFDDEIPF
ncbi:MAG: toll/interleukin-1 receptor domain-containing protein [Hyphomonadaceae bacterium]|nr:toll/interleukin-1 receptor domain-containing protein [Hyphomonadaceae bacterium]